MLAGVLGLVFSEGIPLDIILQGLKDAGRIPCWISMYLDSKQENWSTSTFLNKVEQATTDVYGRDFSRTVMERLRYVIDSFNNPPLAPWRNGKRSSFKNCGLMT